MWLPKRPETLQEAGIEPNFVEDNILKLLYAKGTARGSEFVKMLKLPTTMVDPTVLTLRERDFIAPTGGSGIGGSMGLTFGLTTKGLEAASDIKDRSPYFGPAPVDAQIYTESVQAQRFNSRAIRKKNLDAAFSDIKISPQYLHQMGPAINSGGPIFLYGKPGNGKTTMAERIARLFRQAMFIPYAIESNGEIIQVYDEKVHVPVDLAMLPESHPLRQDPHAADPRWVYAFRPFIVVGGELTLDMLDLSFRDGQSSYEGPFQLKANGGVLLIDDFGRQKVSPTDILNRWIYPLEKQMDFLSLVSGKKVEVPFEIFLIFSTNLDPSDLGDEAFWRRIKYKIETPNPSEEDYKFIFELVCKKNKIAFDEEAFAYLVERYYRKANREYRSVHPRDILNIIADHIYFYGLQPKITKKLIDLACYSFFGMEEVKAKAELRQVG